MLGGGDPSAYLGLGTRKGPGGAEFPGQKDDFVGQRVGQQRMEEAWGSGYMAGAAGQQQQQQQQATRAGMMMLGAAGGFDQQQQQQQLAAEQALRGGPSGYYELQRQQQQQQQQDRMAAPLAMPAIKASAMGGTVLDRMAAANANANGGPEPAAPGRYSLLGLLPLLKLADPDLTMLALGTDLTGLGLNLNSSESLHRSFVSALSDAPVRAEPEFELPACYRHVPQRLQPGCLTKFKEETLFYVFYSMPQDEAQLIAADELGARGWIWHRQARLWMIPAPNSTTQKTQRGERGSFLVFEPSTWEVAPKSDVEIAYEDVEPSPRMARPPKQQQQQQQAGRH